MRLVQNPAFDSQLYKSIIEWADNDDLWDRWKEIYSDMENPNRRVAADKFYYENDIIPLLETECSTINQFNEMKNLFQDVFI